MRGNKHQNPLKPTALAWAKQVCKQKRLKVSLLNKVVLEESKTPPESKISVHSLSGVGEKLIFLPSILRKL